MGVDKQMGVNNQMDVDKGTGRLLSSDRMRVDEETGRLLSFNRTGVNKETKWSLLSSKNGNYALDRCEKASDHVLLSSEMSHIEDESSWYLDMGCSNHMTGKSNWLLDLDTSIKSIVRFVDNSVITAEGSSKVLITQQSVDSWTTPGERIYDDNAAKTHQVGTDTGEEGWLWHYRYGHLNFRSLGQLRDKDLVKGIPTISAPSKVYEGCAIGKQTKKEFKKVAAKRAKQPLEVVYSYVCGPFDVQSLGGDKYFLIFVDEYSRKI
ncbi:uncharacterized protein LOC124824756 [Vigna umbellata]|uniref:uncharacterized protein LOC124824756 n=1 Tax=Vigna umbellata TaxID=87088 RepID=UPI001F5FE708|nr:uncharacterized protein LOC124824756 [Vigna umbellata]